MATSSLYDLVSGSNSEYVPQFIGSNYNELNDAAAKLDQRYRENKDYTDKIAIMLAQEKYLDGDKAIKDNLAKSIYGSVNKIAESDKSFENSSAAVSQLARDFFTNEHRIAALDNYKKVQEAKELRNKLGANALNFGDNPDTFSTLDQQGNIRNFNNAIEQRGDYSGRMQQLLGKVADDGYTTSPTGQKIEFDNYERYLIKSGQVNKISKDKLNALVEGLLPSYKSSAEGTQDLRRLQQLEGLKNTPVTIPIYDNKGKVIGQRQTTPIDEDIRQRFRAIAAPQQFTNSNTRWDDFGLPVGTKGKNPLEDGEGVYTPTAPSAVTDNTTLNAIPDAESLYDPAISTKNEDGTYTQWIDKTTGQPVQKALLPKPQGQKGEPNVFYESEINRYKPVKISPEQIETELQSQYNKTNSAIPGQYKNFQDFKDSYKAAVTNQKKITPSGNVIAPNQADQYDDMLNRSIGSSPLYFKEGSEPVQGLDALAAKIGTSPSNIKVKATKVLYDSPRADLPGGYVEAKIEVSDSKVKEHPTTVFVPLSDQFVALAKPIDDLYKNSFYQGKDTFTPDNPYVPEVNGRPMKDSNGSILSFYTVTSPIPKSQQKAGQPGFRTIVYTSKIVPNGSGGYDVIPGEQPPMPIGQWKQEMTKILEPSFKAVLNSGQTFNSKDYKEQGLEY